MKLRFQTLRARLLITMVGVVILPGLFSLLWSHWSVQGMVTDLLNKQGDDAGQVVDNIFEEFVNDSFLKARIITQTRDLQTAVHSRETIDLINQLSALHQELNLGLYDGVIEVFDPQGRLLASEPRVAKPLADANMVKGALQGAILSGNLFSDGGLKISAVVPIYHSASAAPSGVVAVSFRATHKIAEEIQKLANTHALIFTVPDQGRPQVLATTLPEDTSASLVALYAQGQSNRVSNRRYLMAVTQQSALNGTFYLGAAQDISRLSANLERLSGGLMAFQMFAVLLAFLVAQSMIRNLTYKITALVDGARAIAADQLDQPIVIASQDELGHLARDLDRMRQKIRETLHQKNQVLQSLTLRNAINQAIISHRGNELLNQVLVQIIEALEAEKGSIMMLDKLNGRLMLKIVYNAKEGVAPLYVRDHVSFALGEGVAGRVAETGESMICNDPAQDRRFKTYRFQENSEQRIENLLCIPLKVEDEILGVFSIDNKPGGFEERHQHMLEDIAHQVAVAIQNAELYELSITDGLTGLYIRRYFEAMLEQEVRTSQRLVRETSLVLFDIDHFKKINDTYGHQVGDEVIRRVAALAKASQREGDLAARYGGEEFALILPGTPLELAWEVADRLRRLVQQTVMEYGGHRLQVTISLGCASTPRQATSREQLIERADLALYASKHRGRNRSTCYEDTLLPSEPA